MGRCFSGFFTTPTINQELRASSDKSFAQSYPQARFLKEAS